MPDAPYKTAEFLRQAGQMPPLLHYPDKTRLFDINNSEVCKWLIGLVDELTIMEWAWQKAHNARAIVYDSQTGAWAGSDTDEGRKIVEFKAKEEAGRQARAREEAEDKMRGGLLPRPSGDKGGRPKIGDAVKLLALLGETGLKSSEWKQRACWDLRCSGSTFDRTRRELVAEGLVEVDPLDRKWHAIAKGTGSRTPKTVVSGNGAPVADKPSDPAAVSNDPKSPLREEPIFKQADYAGEVQFETVSEPDATKNTAESAVNMPNDHVLQQALAGRSLDPEREAQ